MTSWGDTLDAFEASLVQHRHLVEHEVVDEASLWPPATLPDGPVPENLRERANLLLSESNVLIDDVAAKMANIPSLKPSRRPHPGTPGAPRWTATL